MCLYLAYLPSSVFVALVSTASFGRLFTGQWNSDMLSIQSYCGYNIDHVRKENWHFE